MGRGRARRTARRMRVRQTLGVFAALVVAVTALLALSACDGGQGGATQATAPASARATTTSGQVAGIPVATVTPTTGAVTTPGAQQGTAEFCAASSASDSAQLPASVPAYPGAQLRLGQSAGGSGIYGLCTGDSANAVAQFYAARLPGKGWGQVTTNVNAGVEQVQATKGDAHLIITAEPDAQLAGTTQIIILTSGM